jgi:hypothetical protein
MSWKFLRRWFKQPGRPVSPVGRFRAPLVLERFEDRLCPSGVPTVTASAANLPITATTLHITGDDFSPNRAQDHVAFNLGAAGKVTAATSTQLTVALTTRPIGVGNLSVVVTSNHQSSGSAVQVATVTPVVQARTSAVAVNASSMVINGFWLLAHAGR